jgi:hypothetical protein
MGIEEPTPETTAPAESLHSFRGESPVPNRPSWADEATVAVPLTELFGDDRTE